MTRTMNISILLRATVLSLAMTVCVVAAPDLAVKSEDVAYDSSLSAFVVTVHNVGAGTAGAFTVAASDVAGDMTNKGEIQKLSPGAAAEVEIGWPRASLDMRVQITIDPDEQIAESNEENNSVELTMWTAITTAAEQVTQIGRAKFTKRAFVQVEAESLARRENIRVQKFSDASGGRAVRLFTPESVVEGEVALRKGLYFLSAVGMGMSPSEDAFFVSLHRTRIRLFFPEPKKWLETGDDQIVKIPRDGEYRLAIEYAEPNVLIDKIIIFRAARRNE